MDSSSSSSSASSTASLSDMNPSFRKVEMLRNSNKNSYKNVSLENDMIVCKNSKGDNVYIPVLKGPDSPMNYARYC